MAVQAVLLDLDGTLYADGAAIPGAPDALRRLREQGVPVRLVTNTTSRSRAALVERLRGYGFEVSAGELFTATLAGAAAAREHGWTRLAPFTPAAALEDLAGFDLAGGTSGMPARGRPDAVVIGDLGETWSYALLQEAFGAILDGAALLALSRDRYWRREGGLALDAGPFVAALEYATGVTALLAGKPSPVYYRAVVESLGFPAGAAGAVAMVGDDLWSDVEGAQKAGLQGWLVRTGKYRPDLLETSGVVPHRILASVAEIGPI